MKRFIVYTFREDREGRKPRYSAYTQWASPSWAGCKTYLIEAVNGTEAKKLAITRRREEEATEAEEPAEGRK